MTPRVEPLTAGRPGSRGDEEQPIELRRQLDALRRGRWTIVGLAVLITAVALGVSLALPKSYTARASILYEPSTNPVASQDPTAVQRELATVSSLAVTPETLGVTAQTLGLSERQLERDVTAKVDATANTFAISATSGRAGEAARIANAVAETFLTRQKAADLQSLGAARANLLQEISRLRAAPNTTLEIQALQQRLSDIGIGEATAGSEFSVAEAARPPVAASSPRPVRNAILAFFASIFLGILVVLGRDQLVPRIGGPRELTRITDRPVVVAIPYVRRRLGRQPKILSAVEHEAYQTLQASLRFQLPARETHIVLLASAREGEGKTTVTANLGRALARAGRKTLVISADMRKPKLHELFDVELGPGLSEILTALERGGESTTRTLSAARGLLTAQAGTKGNLHVLASGKKPQDPARLVLSPGLGILFDELRTMDYEYILVDGTPLIGLADTQALAQRADEMLVVSRLDRLTVEDAVELRDVLDRIEVAPLGHVVIGTRRTVSYSYALPDAE